VHCFVEGVHFDLAYVTPQELGHKLLAIALSDLAATGAEPAYAMLTLGVTQSLTDHFVAEFFQGAGQLARKHKVAVEGGNVTNSPQALVVHVLVVAKAHPENALPFAASPGDMILVTGSLGASAAGLNCLKQIGRATMEEKREIILPHILPQPRVAESQALVKAGVVTSLVDLSEGLATDLNRLAQQSGVGALIEEAMLPVSEHTEMAGRLLPANHRLWTLYGAEDYELLFTVKPEHVVKVEKALARHPVSFTVIGQVQPKKKGVQLRTASGEVNPFEPRGWHHFVRRRK
jgi:thiamine-monophosphate kinase